MNAREAIMALKSLDSDTELWIYYADTVYEINRAERVVGFGQDGEVWAAGTIDLLHLRNPGGEELSFTEDEPGEVRCE